MGRFGTLVIGLLLCGLAAFVAGERCNVFLLGKGLCACYKNDHCKEGRGCLSKDCNKSSCGFPRICLCKPIIDEETGEETEDSNCFPVNRGPCENCYPPGLGPSELTDKGTPREMLLLEFSTLDTYKLRGLAAEAGLSTEGSDKDLITRLVDLTLEQEAFRDEA